jgi:hypothetical protein
MNRLKKCSIYTQFFIQPQRMILCHLQVNNEVENIILSVNQIRLRRSKITCSPSYADYRPKTNATILIDKGHTKGRPCTRGIEQGKEPKP